VTIAFVDLAGFTALTDAHGDVEAITIAKAFQQQVIGALGPGDRLVKTIGDAVMLAFPDPAAALVALERILTHEPAGTEWTLLRRAGAHHGPAIVDDGDFYGHTVNVAARVASHAAGGQLLVTSRTAIAARDLGYAVTHVGSTTLRNLAEPVDLYEVRFGDETSDLVVDPVCSMRVPPAGEHTVALEWRGKRTWFCGLPCAARFAADPDAYQDR
jgi:adenylate cyclase